MIPFSVLSNGRIYVVKAVTAEAAELQVAAQTGYGAEAKIIRCEANRWKKARKNTKRKAQRQRAFEKAQSNP